MFQLVNVCYVSKLAVDTKDVVNNFDVVLAAISAIVVRLLVCLSVCNEFHHFAMSVQIESISSNRLMFVIFQFLLLVLIVFE